MADEKLAFAAILGFVSGLLVLIIAVIELIGVALAWSTISGLPVAGWVGYLVAAGFLLGLLTVVCAALLVSHPEYHIGIGAVLLVLSVLVFFLVPVGVIVFLPILIGGACAIAFGEGWYSLPDLPAGTSDGPPTHSGLASVDLDAMAEPSTPSAPSEHPPTLYRGCLNCGKFSPAGAVICSHCGAKL